MSKVYHIVGPLSIILGIPIIAGVLLSYYLEDLIEAKQKKIEKLEKKEENNKGNDYYYLHYLQSQQFYRLLLYKL